MRIGTGEHSYEWIEEWAEIPDSESARSGFSHTGVIVTGAQHVVTFHPRDRALLEFDRDGRLLGSWDVGVENAHDIVLVEDAGAEFLWLADNLSGQVIKTSMNGGTVMSISRPDYPVYREGKYSPTSLAVDERKFGGSGDIWVTDGYGSYYVHRYTQSGEYVGSINGEDGGGGRFVNPHGIRIDRRGRDPELYVADRGNGQVQVYDLDGAFKRVFGTDYLYRPCSFTTVGENLVVVEHRAGRLTVLDRNDDLVCYLGENPGVEDIPGYPNVGREHIHPGKFSSPHGVAADADGNLYVIEWMVGGRTIRLVRT